MTKTNVSTLHGVGSKQRLSAWVRQFNHKFDADKSAIDLREMVENYPTGHIPVLHISDGVNAAIGLPPIARKSIDPRKMNRIPKFEWVDIDLCVVDPRFQRDLAPNHVGKIEKHYDGRMIIVPCAIKMWDEDRKEYVYCIWDGGHTIQLLIRHGWTHVPVWYTSIEDLSEDELKEAEDAMIGLAGRSFLAINKTFKRPVSGYDEFMILLETKDVDAMTIMRILTSNGCKPYRYKRGPGDVTHFEALWEVYNLQNASGIKGTYLARALAFHRHHWPMASVEAEIMRPMAMLYAMCDQQLGRMPSAQFDEDLGMWLISKFGSAESCQEGIKAAYAKAFPNGRDNFPHQVANGLINAYMRHINKEDIAVPQVRFDV